MSDGMWESRSLKVKKVHYRRREGPPHPIRAEGPSLSACLGQTYFFEG